MVQKNFFITRVSEVDMDLLAGCRCPACSELYTLGFYLVRGEGQNVYVGTHSSTCVNCGIEGLHAPLLFYSEQEALRFLNDEGMEYLQCMSVEQLELYFINAQEFVVDQNATKMCM